MKTLFKNVRVLNLEKGLLEKADVLIKDDTISQIGKIDCDADKIIEGNNNILMPGFVNAHAHNPMTLLKNTFDDYPLESWLFDNILPKEDLMTEQDVYWGEMLGIAESVKNGITSFEECYFHQEKMVEAIVRTKIRARVGMGKAIGDTSLEENIRALYSYCKDKPLVTNMLFAHAVYTYSVEELETMVRLSNELKLPLSIHMSETLKEVGDCDTAYGKSPAGLLESVGYFDKPCLVYHGVHCDKDDMQILAQYNVSVATCPASNIKLASGIAPVVSYLERGINVCIGTDGPASNNSLDMFKEMFLTSTLAKVYTGKANAISVIDILKMATINGAKALGFENVGLVKQGWKADLILIDTNSLHFQPENDTISALVYSANGSDVKLTMVNGNILYEDGKFNIGEDIETIKMQCQKIANKLKG